MKNHFGKFFQAEEYTAPDFFFRPIFLAFVEVQ